MSAGENRNLIIETTAHFVNKFASAPSPPLSICFDASSLAFCFPIPAPMASDDTKIRSDSGEAALPKLATELNIIDNGAFASQSEGLKNSLQSGVVAMKRPTNTPTTGGGRARFARSISFVALLFVSLLLLLSGINTERPKLQKYGLHPIKNNDTNAVLWAT
mmetsp:Transcript_3886/g.6717  ORF Transcript_3886/g.6717 Transcript_3886/m.6717 type:complete len:162 (-) Transcript_3886:471-956(-)